MEPHVTSQTDLPPLYKDCLVYFPEAGWRIGAVVYYAYGREKKAVLGWLGSGKIEYDLDGEPEEVPVPLEMGTHWMELPPDPVDLPPDPV